LRQPTNCMRHNERGELNGEIALPLDSIEVKPGFILIELFVVKLYY